MHAQFLTVKKGKTAQHGFAMRSEFNKNFTTIRIPMTTLNSPLLHETIDQLDYGVMAQAELLG
jgi:hypothetical protein